MYYSIEEVNKEVQELVSEYEVLWELKNHNAGMEIFVENIKSTIC